jgi:Kef-type K+ transport system membrane component KefB
LITARIFGEICRKFNQPAVIGEILAGIMLGPSLLGSVFPDLFKEIFISQPRSYAAFDGLANIGIILLMFIAGFEVDLKQIRKQGNKRHRSVSWDWHFLLCSALPPFTCFTTKYSQPHHQIELSPQCFLERRYRSQHFL